MDKWGYEAFGIAVAVAIVVVAAILVYHYQIHNVGRIKAAGVKFYLDEGCTSEVSLIDWGDVAAGGQYGATLYAKNTGNVNVTLSYETENWEPATAETFLIFSWSYDGSVLSPLDAVAIMFQLEVLPTVDAVGSFSFDIVVTATEVA